MSNSTTPIELPPSSSDDSEPQPSPTEELPASSAAPPPPPPSPESSNAPPESTQDPKPPVVTSIVTAVSTTSSDGTIVTLTSTSFVKPITVPAAQSTTDPVQFTSASSSAYSSDVSSLPNSDNGHSGGGGGGGGLNGTTRVVVAVVVPVVSLALIAVALLFLWKRRNQKRNLDEKRRKEVEDYGFNPNLPPAGGVVGVGGNPGDGNSGEDGYGDVEGESAGYRGWGSTSGGRKLSTMGTSTLAGAPVGMAYSDGSYQDPGLASYQDPGHGSYQDPGLEYMGAMATSPTTGTAPSSDGTTSHTTSNAPLVNPPLGNRPDTTDSSIVAAMTGPSANNNEGGVHRGISNASSNYSAITDSDQSIGTQPGQYEGQYYGADGYDQNYSGHPYQQYHDPRGYAPPVIRDVSARRNTRIETPTDTHFPQQGNSGIAQNF